MHASGYGGAKYAQPWQTAKHTAAVAILSRAERKTADRVNLSRLISSVQA